MHIAGAEGSIYEEQCAFSREQCHDGSCFSYGYQKDKPRTWGP